MNMISDSAERKQALDINASFAVQAPAGSGKTELLSLRFLRLLSVCEKPEEILAITFTRKAANEMAQRILNTLDWAAEMDDPSKLTDQLDIDRFSAAQQVLLQNEKLDWQLRESPGRLKIQTIDSFCHFLASRLPVLSGFGGSLAVSDQADDCYQDAISNCLLLLDADLPVSQSISALLLHLDNDIPRLEKMLLSLLRQRDQWIDAVFDVAGSPDEAFDYLIHSVKELTEEHLLKLAGLLSPLEGRLLPIVQFAATNLQQSESDSPIKHCLAIEHSGTAECLSLPVWHGITDLLLTAKSGWRKRITVKEGFPAASSSKQHAELYTAMKKAMEELLEELSNSADDHLLEALSYVRLLPSLEKGSYSFDFLRTLTQVLPSLLAELEITFAARNKVDHPQVSHAALASLGTDDSPTDLALSLDYRIKHILVDEFQDTSTMQLQLLHKLTAGWEPEDGRTFFVVGDAMQSCYSFRNADVGLFISLRENGLRDLEIAAIDLHANFRSDAGVVSWVNDIFAPSFPAANNISRGAVTYSPSQPVHPTRLEPAVTTRCYSFEDSGKSAAYDEEANYIAKEIVRLRREDAACSSAILVKSRSHLIHILPALRELGVPWQATEIDKLNNLPIITDLLSLTKALCNQADRLSWLALLRSPLCGIPLNDLLAIAEMENTGSVLQSLMNVDDCQSISAESSRRVKAVTGILTEAVINRDRIAISRLVRETFTQLGGALVVQSPLEKDSIDRYLDLLHSNEIAGEIIQLAEFELQLEKTFVSDSPTVSADNPVQIMTIHKSKGLEFDHVFLPGLARQPRVDDRNLLIWHKRLNQSGEPRLFLATLAGAGETSDALYDLLRHEKSLKTKFENTRLLYIAVTRARKSAQLSATLKHKDDGVSEPDPRSLLHSIWHSLQQDPQFQIIQAQDTSIESRQAIDPTQQAQFLVRLPLDLLPYSSIDSESGKTREEAKEETREEVRNELDESSIQQHNALQIEIGNLVHQSLQTYLTNRDVFTDEKLAVQRLRWKAHFHRYGFDEIDIDTALEQIETSIKNTVATSDINWIFDHSLQESAAELPMQSFSGAYLQNHVLDRTFIDSQGCRWIIDYKTAIKPDTQSQEEFFKIQTQHYSHQMNRYRKLFDHEDNTGIKTALLFTSLAKLLEIPAA